MRFQLLAFSLLATYVIAAVIPSTPTMDMSMDMDMDMDMPMKKRDMSMDMEMDMDMDMPMVKRTAGEEIAERAPQKTENDTPGWGHP